MYLSPPPSRTHCFEYKPVSQRKEREAICRYNNTRKPFGGRGSAPDPAGVAYSAPPDTPSWWGGRLAAPLHQNPTPLSALPTPLQYWVWVGIGLVGLRDCSSHAADRVMVTVD